MLQKEIKTALKDVREAIKNKEFDTAISKCQEILKADSENYMGLVLMGAAYQSKDKKEAAKYLRKAITKSEDPTVALQGLANCAEIEELPDIYGKLLQLVPEKFIEYHSKLITLGENQKCLEECIIILKKEIQLENSENYKARILSAKQCIGRILIQQTEIPENLNDLFKISLEAILEDNQNTNNFEVYKRYLKLLYKLRNLEDLIKHACIMTEQYPTQPYPLEWICKIYSENFQTINIEKFLKNPIEFYINNLINLNQQSELGLRAKAIKHFTEHQYVQAKELLLQIKHTQINSSLSFEYLVKIYIELEAYELAEQLFRKLMLKPLEFAKCLSYSNENEKLNEAVILLNEILPELKGVQKSQALVCLARSYFRLQQIDSALTILDKLKNEGEEISVVLSNAEYLKSPSEAISLLNDIKCEEFSFDFLKGKLYFELKDYENSIIHLLKATRQKPYSSECFLWLGKVYLISKDLIRARKCFEKSISLNPLNDLAIKYLSEIYRKNEEWDLNEALLKNLLKNSHGNRFAWALFQLGGQYLYLKNFDEAINSFRTALRYDLTNISCWEGLADSYYHRGSFNSAMKVFQKILELDSDNIYAKLKLATIKSTLHMHKEAVDDFNELLEEHSDYLPALKGAAEAHYGLANYLLCQRLIGRSKDHLQKAINYLQKAFSIGKRDMIWLWRLMASIFCMIGNMPTTKAIAEVSGKLAGQEEDIVFLEKEELFEFAERFYTCALKLNQTDSLLWHGLSLCYYNHAQKYGNESSKTKHMKLALDACKNSLKLQGKRWQNWNLLGVIYATKEINNLQLAQHCFIEALQLERKSAIAWTNLGVLYLSQNNIKLANKAFGRAQQSDTSFNNAWIGQAIIAEYIGETDEAIDLFRHSTQLEFHLESALGYAYWICSILSKPDKLKDNRYKYAIENMDAITVASDSINWYYTSELEQSSTEALSYLGYLKNKQLLWNGAVHAYQLATKKVQNLDKDKMFCNLGYSFLKTNQIHEAIEAFNSVNEATFKSTIGLALAYFRSGQYQESYSVYDSALEWLASNDAEKALTLVAMSSMVYEAQGENDTKTILLQCIALQNPPIQAFYSACSLGIIHHDKQLSEIILDELKQYENDDKHSHHIAFLTAEVYKSMNQIKKGLLYLLSRVHAFPNRPLLRKVLANYLLQNFENSQKHLIAVSQIAQSTISLGLIDSKRSTSMEVAKSLAIASHAMSYVDQKKRNKLAQSAVHINPISKEAWSALIACK